MSAIRSYTLVVTLCCLNGITMAIVNGSYSSEGSDAIEIAPIPPNLFTEFSIGKNDLSTDVNHTVNDGQNKAIYNGFVFLELLHLHNLT